VPFGAGVWNGAGPRPEVDLTAGERGHVHNLRGMIGSQDPVPILQRNKEVSMRKLFVVCVLGALLGGGLATAQETTGAILGTVTSQDGATLPGATVTINDPETGLQRTTVTNTAGEFKFVALPPANYEVTATLDGFQTYKRELRVDLGRTVKNDFQMALGAVTDVIEVTGEAPLIDVTSTVTGLTVSTEELNARLPVVREATQVALLAPSTAAGDTAFSSAGNLDRGYTPGQNLVSVGGSSVAENAYQVNGLNITNFRNGVGGSMVPFEFMEELQVKTGGYEAEFGRSTGGVINIVTKSGTNSLRGSANVYYQPESLQEQSPDTYAAYNSAEELELTELNASLGGALVRDKLFFFLFGTYVDSSTNPAQSNRASFWEMAQPYYGGKLDWNMTASHRVEATYLSDEVEVDNTVRGYDPGAGFGDVSGTGLMSRGGENYIGKYTGIFTENFLLSAQYGFNQFDRVSVSTADLSCPAVYDSRAGGLDPLGCWVNFTPTPEALDERTAYRVDLDWYLGNHSLRGGIDYEENTSSNTLFYSAGEYFRYFLNTRYPQVPLGSEIVRLRHITQGGTFDANSNAAYVQDSWALTPTLTVNLGVRYEAFENSNALGEPFIKITDQYAPRVGAIWDPSGSGRSKVFGSYGVYHLPVASNTNIRMAGSEFFDEGYYAFSGGIDPTTGAPGQLGQELQYRLISTGEIPDPRTNRDNNIDPMYQEELILGYERMVSDNWSLGARFVARQFGEVIEDITLDRALYEKYGMTDLGDCFSPANVGSCAHEYRLTNPGTDFEGYADLDGDGEPDPISFTASELRYPEGKRDYYAVELTFKRRFASNWMLQGSYTWSQSYGNYEGYVNSDLGQDDAGITESFDHAGLLENGEGYLPNDHRHNFKVFGAYAWDVGLQVGASFWFQTGRPINGFGVYPEDMENPENNDPWAQSYDNYAFYNQSGACPRGCGGTTDDLWNLDLSLKYDFTVGGLDMNLRADVFNVTDEAGVTEVDEFAQEASSEVNPFYLDPLHFQNPRRVRFGVGLTF
jgi:outer membrane receptor protein involved in Fe transport